MTRGLALILLVAVAVAGLGCATLSLRTLERPEVADESGAGPDGRAVRLSGLAFHSALSVKRIEQLQEAGAVRIRILLGLAGQGESGRFDVMVPIPPGGARVLFGDAGLQVWPTTP